MSRSDTTTRTWLPTAFYLVVTDFARLGFGAHGDPTEKFDEAVDAYIEAREAGQPAAVYRIQPTTGDCIDVTAEATDRARHFWACNGVEAPAWADAASERRAAA